MQVLLFGYELSQYLGHKLEIFPQFGGNEVCDSVPNFL